MNAKRFIDNIDPALTAIEPYTAGKPPPDNAAGGAALKLSANENPLGAGRAALNVLAEPPPLHTYPDASASRLRAAIGEQIGVAAANIVCGNGSGELIMLAAQLALRPGRKAVMSEHAFVLYRRACIACGGEPVAVDAANFGHDLDAMATAADDPDVAIVFVANPNNPTGSWHDADAINNFIAKVPERVLIVLDEAYQEYAGEPAELMPGAALARENLLVTRTFSKIHGLASLRVGYAIACDEICQLLNLVGQPFRVNAFAQAAATAAIADHEHVSLSQQTNRAGLSQLAAGLANRGYQTMNSQANFIAFAAEDSAAVFDQLAAGGVMVRRIDEYGLPNWLRVTVGTEADNERFLQLLPVQRR